MFSALIITSAKQTPIYNEDSSAQAFAVIEKLADLAGAVLQAVRNVKLGGGSSLRSAQA